MLRGGVELSSTPHAPLYAVDVHNNTIKDSGIVYPNSWFGNNSLTGGCITLFGLKGENNNARDIKIYDNSLKSCGLGIYFVASFWPISDNNSGLVNYTTLNQKNEYVSVYNNMIDNFGPLVYTPEAAPNKVDILVQAQPVAGIGNRDSIVMYNNLIKTDPKSTTFDNRCNTLCISNNDCLEAVPTLYGSGTSIVSGYPNSYVCSVGKCRNRDDVNDDNCDLNDQNSKTNKAPIINAGVDQVITLPSSVNLLGTAIDDGLPNGTQSLTSTWSKISGNGVVTFADANSLTTRATFSSPGVYTLKLSVSDSILTTTENVIVSVIQPIHQVEAPIFSSLSTQFELTDTLIVYLSTPTSGALIRYTTDESDPTTTRGILYSEPISISTTTTLKAIAYKEGMDNSNVVTQTYTKSNQQPTSSLVIYAKGTRALQDITSTSICQNGYPNMVVKYNDDEIGRKCLDERSPSGGYIYSIDVPNADPSKLTIHFTNDFYLANIEDRDMIIEKIVLNGTETMLPSELVYAKGSWTSTYGCGLDMERPMTSSNTLGCSGYVRLRQQ
ncbi:chitobiase/beta-hexosaminidase C-terminal domain-containing protein [bacterium]|nr:MAG: chitobiase/beta-hexosaminidase C-terminal domain-containing protein [bacterium]